MAISRLVGQDKTGTSATTSVSATYPGSTTAGNLLIAVPFGNGSGTVAPAMSGWTLLINGHAYGSSARQIAIYYKLADGTENTVTATQSAATSMSISIFEYTGNANPILTDGIAGAQDNGVSGLITSYTTPTITTANANDLIFSVMSTAAASGFAWTTSTKIGEVIPSIQVDCGEYIVSAIQTNFQDTGTWTGSSNAGSLIAAFQAAASAAPTQEFLMYNNVGMGR